MKISNLVLKNYRKYEDAVFFFHKRFTIIIGNNGAGKTTILDAMATMLATYFQGSGIKVGRNTIGKEDRRLFVTEKGGQISAEPQQDVYIVAEGVLRDMSLSWQRDAGDRGGKAKKLVKIGADDRKRISKGESLNLPILLYYGSGRLWDIHRDIETEKPGSQLDAYRFCLDPKSDQKAFQKWFKKLSLAAVQKHDRPTFALEVVRKAVMHCIPDAADFFHDIDHDEPVIRFRDGEVTFFNMLSDGYRNMVAMVADIAYRASRLNAHLGAEAAEKSTGVVLIDEIDLHLHPKWQKQVVGDLQKAFPSMQFVATTHSPFIIQSAAEGEIIDLNQSPPVEKSKEASADFASPGARAAYVNRSIEDIAEDVMGLKLPQRSRRYQMMYETAKEYYRLLHRLPPVEPEEKAIVKRKLDELAAPFSDNVAYHAFLEMERLAAGFGDDTEAETD